MSDFDPTTAIQLTPSATAAIRELHTDSDSLYQLSCSKKIAFRPFPQKFSSPTRLNIKRPPPDVNGEFGFKPSTHAPVEERSFKIYGQVASTNYRMSEYGDINGDYVSALPCFMVPFRQAY
jgi:hypothetical protein